MSIKKGIGYSPLTQKIYLGKQDKTKGMWVGDKEDITSDFINVLFQYVGKNESRKITTVNRLDETILCNIPNTKEGFNIAIKFFKRRLAEITT